MSEARFRWRHATLCGFLLALVIVVVVSLTQPVGALDAGELARVALSIFINYLPVALVWAFGAKLAAEGERPRLGLLATLACAWSVGMALDMLPYTRVAPGGGDGVALFVVPYLDVAIYNFWINLFYGGLYALGFVNARRMLKMRRRLAELRVNRDAAEAAMREARLAAVRGQIQPALLLEAMRVLQHTYDRDAAEGDALFGELVAFLRAAMPSLRAGVSTLKGELALVEGYGALRGSLSLASPPWRVSLAQPAQDAPFPAVRLLPALDRASRSLPEGAAMEIEARAAPDAFRLRIGASAQPPLPAAIVAGLRDGLRRDLAGAAAMATDLPAPWLCELTLASPGRGPAPPC